eukprot:scaffold684_cov345-Pavlova_lutheri.AAC.15
MKGQQKWYIWMHDKGINTQGSIIYGVPPGTNVARDGSDAFPVTIRMGTINAGEPALLSRSLHLHRSLYKVHTWKEGWMLMGSCYLSKG